MTIRLHIAATIAAYTLAAVSANQSLGQMGPDEQLKTLRVPEGFEISLFASEPMITNPSAIDIDTHGRVWVAEIQWYRAKAKQPPADQIKVLEDTDGDGRADKVTVFADGVFAPMSICVAGEKVFVATSPDLWVYEDKNGDLRADGPPQKLLTGFGGFNHDHGAHSLVLGPDHNWWMSHGDAGFDVTGTDGSHIKYRWGAMLRGELDGSKLEIVAENFRNPYELCVSSFGECYMSDNDNDGNESVRAGWVLEGGNYGWFGSPPGPKGHVPPHVPFSQHWHFRGHIPGHVPATLVTGFGSPCGIFFYEGDAFGPRLKNAPLHCDAGPREVRIYRHELAGFGMKATSENIVTTEGDNYFRPDDICAAPDGSLYIADWYDGGVGGHAYNDPDRGRIFRLAPRGKVLKRSSKPGPYQTMDDAIVGLKSPNLATQYLARDRLLAEGTKSVPALNKLLDDPDPNFRARALWLLDRIGGDGRAAVVEQLQSGDSSFRALAVRILRRHDGLTTDQLRRLAADPSDEVRREILLWLRRVPSAAAMSPFVEIARSYDGSDRYQLEALHVAVANRKAEAFEKLGRLRDWKWTASNFGLLQLINPTAASEFLAQRLSARRIDPAEAKTLLDAAATTASPEAGRSVLKLFANLNARAEIRAVAIQKLDANLGSSWKSLATDDQLASALRSALAEPDLQPAVLGLVGTHGIASLSADVQKLAGDSGATVEVRNRAIAVAARLNAPGISETLRSLLGGDVPELREAALNTLVDLQDLKTLKNILSPNQTQFAPEVQWRAAERLLASTGGALVLFRLVDSNGVSSTLRQQIIGKAANHPDSNVRTLFEKYIPPDQRPKRLGDAVKPDEILALRGDAKRGEQIFFQSSAAQCKNCHVVHGRGETVGPDLSQIGKKYERATLLETILDPSKAIAPEYYTYLLETDRGQVFAGFLIEKTDQQIVLKDAKGEIIRIPANQVTEMVKTDKSIMPDLVLRDVPAQDAADLLAFLQTLSQGTQSVATFRVLGPFRNNERSLDEVETVEKSVAEPDLDAEYQSFGGKKLRWDLITADSSAGFPAVDTVKYDTAHGFRPHGVTHYFLVVAGSPSDQTATLLIGSDDGCKVWVNGELVHRNASTRALGYAQDRVAAKLRTGHNVIVVKVVNGDGAGGLSLGITSTDPVQLKTTLD